MPLPATPVNLDSAAHKARGGILNSFPFDLVVLEINKDLSGEVQNVEHRIAQAERKVAAQDIVVSTD